MNKLSPQKILDHGVSSLLPQASFGEKAATGASSAILNLPIDKIVPNALQPRRHFDEEKLDELASSIREHGILQPVIVSRTKGHYQLVVGERRWRAAQRAGLTEIPVLVREFAEAHGLEVALIENIQRQDLSPLEEAAAYQFLMREYALKQEEVARRVGKSRSAVANAIRLLNLPQPVLDDIQDGTISAGHARALLSLEEAAQQSRVWTRIKRHQLSVRQTEAYVRSLLEGNKTPAGAKKRRRLPVEWIDVQESLQRHLSAQVKIRPRSRATGKIEIHYSSSDELDRLVQSLLTRSSASMRRNRLSDDLL